MMAASAYGSTIFRLDAAMHATAATLTYADVDWNVVIAEWLDEKRYTLLLQASITL